MGYGVMMALEGKDDLIAKLSAAVSLADALTSDAEGFVDIRADLIEAVSSHRRNDARLARHNRPR
jgi:hypothetical protein